MDHPLTDQEFADRMAAFAPFETAPRLAVGVSGGADSLALTLLADRWARARGGAVVGLTVDHGLRAAAAQEAAQVGMWLARHGIVHRILPWAGEKPRHDLQAAARAARRALLIADCRRNGILHLLLAHQEDDQAETLVMRLAADSGPDGLAGIAAVAENADLRILRPLLDVPRARLAATLHGWKQGWIDDPSNRDPRFSRSRVRSLVADASTVAAPAARLARERADRDAQIAELLARGVSLFPEGWAVVALAVLSTAPAALARRALARVLMCVGGQTYPPASSSLDRLYEALCRGALGGGRTLAGCRVVPRRQSLLIVRERAATQSALPVRGPGDYLWDGRFHLHLAGAIVAQGMTIETLGEGGWRDVAARRKDLRSLAVPAVARTTLAALCDLEGVVEVPHLSYRREGADPDSVKVVSAIFRPHYVLAGAGFAGLSSAGGNVAGDRAFADRRKEQELRAIRGRRSRRRVRQQVCE